MNFRGVATYPTPPPLVEQAKGRSVGEKKVKLLHQQKDTKVPILIKYKQMWLAEAEVHPRVGVGPKKFYVVDRNMIMYWHGV